MSVASIIGVVIGCAISAGVACAMCRREYERRLHEMIVRCRDCDSWSGPCEIRPDGIEGVCDGWSATGNVVLTREDDFCSYGARREEER